MNQQRTFRLDQMKMNSLISAMPKNLKNALKKGIHLEKDDFYYTATRRTNLSSYAYKCFIGTVEFKAEKLQKWNAECEGNMSLEEYSKSFKNNFSVSNIAKYRSFQYRLLHRSVLLNNVLYKWKIVNSNLCTFCGEEVETYPHLFVMCKSVRDLWIGIEHFMMTFNKEEITFDVKSVILNNLVKDARNIKNSICLYVKQYIYRKRCYKEKPKLFEIKEEILRIQGTERYIAIKNGHLAKHEKKWYNIKPGSSELSIEY